ncbi:MAG: 2-amino-4-hydroxy-6-hydroxymethyldihydropteridine diphosphokinase [Saprospiraceae bacterium]|nr:2-amino-4-hydroxy-6-hydroxymethyldihydropteridine diphosphokinase [Saprospiraceae bacterium]
MSTYYLLLGSNQGDRENNLKNAHTQIEKMIGKINKKSSVYETEPWGLENQDNFLNMVIAVRSELKPLQVLGHLKKIEAMAGPAKTAIWGPRLLDIDILYCDDLIFESEQLNIPHKQIYNRNFTLIPLIEIAGDMIDPVKQITIDEIYDQCTDDKEVFIYEN